VKIEAEIAGFDEIIMDLVGDPVRTRAAPFPWEGAIQVPFVDREKPLLCDEPLNVQNGETDERPTDVGMLSLPSDFSDDFDPVAFVTVNCGRTVGNRPGPAAVDNRHRKPNRITEKDLAHWMPEFLRFAGVYTAAIECECFRLLFAHQSLRGGA
jgi:hypothetical protein